MYFTTNITVLLHSWSLVRSQWLFLGHMAVTIVPCNGTIGMSSNVRDYGPPHLANSVLSSEALVGASGPPNFCCSPTELLTPFTDAPNELVMPATLLLAAVAPTELRNCCQPWTHTAVYRCLICHTTCACCIQTLIVLLQVPVYERFILIIPDDMLLSLVELSQLREKPLILHSNILSIQHRHTNIASKDFALRAIKV